MTIAATPVPLSEARTRLSELAMWVRQQHEGIILTRNGEPEAVLLSIDDFEALEMTLESSEMPTLSRASRRAWQRWRGVSRGLTCPTFACIWPSAASPARKDRPPAAVRVPFPTRRLLASHSSVTSVVRTRGDTLEA
jgi:prevent-host-death family protein